MGYFTATSDLLVGVYETRMKRQDLEKLLGRLNEAYGSLKSPICQFFNADRVISALYVATAATAAIVAWRSKTNVAKRLEVEFLVKLSAQDQISRAIELVGVSYEANRVGVCIVSKSVEEIETVKSKLEVLLGCKLIPFVDNQSDYMVSVLSKVYDVPEQALKSIQADNSFKALELFLMEKVAISLISR
ncbi:MAG: KEOPS complex subunit Cgi121 [Halobacteria archaeon]